MYLCNQNTFHPKYFPHLWLKMALSFRKKFYRKKLPLVQHCRVYLPWHIGTDLDKGIAYKGGYGDA